MKVCPECMKAQPFNFTEKHFEAGELCEYHYKRDKKIQKILNKYKSALLRRR